MIELTTGERVEFRYPAPGVLELHVEAPDGHGGQLPSALVFRIHEDGTSSGTLEGKRIFASLALRYCWPACEEALRVAAAVHEVTR